ncbi:MAG: hypothetical protein GY847_01110 [Proteobacteria bacterium]|nr:hypothetical protein [Pseudomonadota bacterium]
MSYTFDFGFENPGSKWDDAKLAFLFAAPGEEADFGQVSGPLAVADASRFVEFFEMQDGLNPLSVGVYAELCGGSNPLAAVASRAKEARDRNIIPVTIGDDRRITENYCAGRLVAMWGKVGRQEADEPTILNESMAMLVGVRAATSTAFKTIPADVMIVTCHGVSVQPRVFAAALKKLTAPVHLSIDLDVLSPSVAQTPRSLEPGGLSWYNFTDAIEMVFKGPGVAAVDLIGTGKVSPRSPSALLSAQILTKIAGLTATESNK